MPRRRTGTIEPRVDAQGRTYYLARIRLADKSRPWFRVPDEHSRTEARAREWATYLQEQEDAKKRILAARQEKRGAPLPAGETVTQWADRWLAERKARGLTAVDTDGGRLRRHVLPLLGPKPMKGVTSNDIEDVRDALDAKVRAAASTAIEDGDRPRFHWKTALNTWGLLTRMFRDARASKNRALRVREDDPTVGVAPPERGTKTGKVYLYPDEFLRLVSCEDVPLKWRRLYAVDTYLYARAAEVKALDWRDVDLVRGVVHIHKAVDRRTGKEAETKSGVARRLPIEPELAPLLEAMNAAVDSAGRVITELPDTDRKLARQLRRHLLIAGVDRPELHKGTPATKPLTFHDLRATGITWCAVRGDDPLRIKQRAGHTTFSTTEGYIREAENLRAAFGTVFPPLPASLLNRSTDWTIEVATSRKYGGAAGNRKPCDEVDREDSPGDRTSGDARPRTTTSDNHAIDRTLDQSMVQRSDLLEHALAEALRGATEAGRWDLVAQLGRELDARRVARLGNVVVLPGAGRAARGRS